MVFKETNAKTYDYSFQRMQVSEENMFDNHLDDLWVYQCNNTCHYANDPATYTDSVFDYPHLFMFFLCCFLCCNKVDDNYLDNLFLRFYESTVFFYFQYYNYFNALKVSCFIFNNNF